MEQNSVEKIFFEIKLGSNDAFPTILLLCDLGQVLNGTVDDDKTSLGFCG